MKTEDFQKFAVEWADVFEGFVQNQMKQLGVSADLIGMRDDQGNKRAFNPNDFLGGGVNSEGIEVDAGILNSSLLVNLKAGQPLPTWQKARLRHRIEAVIAHEWTEYRFLALQSAHDLALQFAPQTPGLSLEARAILEEMRDLLREK